MKILFWAVSALLCVGVVQKGIAVDDESNVLLSNDPVQISSNVDEYENLTADKPITGLVMVTRPTNSKTDTNSFRIGDKALKVEFVQETKVPYGDETIGIYKFQIDGKKNGQYTLPSIFVKVNGKEYQAPPMTIQIGNP